MCLVCDHIFTNDHLGHNPLSDAQNGKRPAPQQLLYHLIGAGSVYLCHHLIFVSFRGIISLLHVACLYSRYHVEKLPVLSSIFSCDIRGKINFLTTKQTFRHFLLLFITTTILYVEMTWCLFLTFTSV